MNIDYSDCKSNLMKMAKRELSLVNALEDWEMYRGILEVFSKQGHSGGSASVVIPMLNKMLLQEPLSPLTGEDGEWTDVAEMSNEETLYQNKRCSSVFKNDKGPYDINGKVFVEPNGSSYTSGDSFVDIEFPYTPKTEYVNVPFPEDEDKS
jgi:hypothetical protein